MPLPGNRELLFQSVLWVLLLCNLMIGAAGLMLGDASGIMRPPHLMLLPGSALVILVSGVGLLSLIYQRTVIRFICVSVLILLLGYGLFQLMQRNSSNTAVWLPPMSLLMILMGAVSLALGIDGRVRRLVWWLTALFFISVGLASLLFYLRPASGLLPQSLVASSLMGGTFCLLFGVSMLIVAGIHPRRLALLSREAMIAGAIGVVASGIAWYLVSWQQYQYQREAAYQDVVHVAEMTEQHLDSHSKLMTRLTSRWQHTGSSSGGHNIRDLELRSYLRDFPSLQALSVTGRKGQWRRARTTEGLFWLDEHLDDEDVKEWLAGLSHGQAAWYFPVGASASSMLHGVRLGSVLSVAAVDLAGVIELGNHDHLDADVVKVVQDERLVVTLDHRASALEDTLLPAKRISEVTLDVGEGQSLTFIAYADWPGMVTLAGLLPVLVGALGLTLTYQLVASLSLMASRTAWGRQLQAASRELRVSEQRFRSLFTQNQDGVFTHSREGVYESLNPAAAATLGIAENELLGRHYHSIVQTPVCSPEDVEQTDAAFQRAAAGSPGSYTMRFSRDGEHFQHLEVTMLPIIVDGEVNGVFGIAKNVTDRVTAEERLRVLQRSLDASLNGVIISEAGQRKRPIIYVNQAFTDITGYSFEEAMGRDCQFLQGPDSETAHIEEIHQGLEARQEVRVTLRNYRKGGSVFWNQLYVSPVMDAHGCVTHFVSIVHDISERKAQESKLAYHATHDPLTNLANRSLLEDRLSHDVALGTRHHRLLGVLFIDLDEFKPINDTLGHAIGDEVLIQVARRLEQGVRPSDTVARFGGDEFVVVLPDIAYEGEALMIGERLVESLARPYRIQQHELHLSASIGIALGQGGEYSAQLLIQQADMAMYKAKRRGRRTCELFTQDINDKLSRRMQLRNDLDTALDAQQFELYYQPLIRRDNGSVAGCEALVRWHHPDNGFVSPAEFIPLAEETGLIVPLGRWILERACHDFRMLRERGLTNCRVAVNLSPIQFNRPDFFKGLCQMLEQVGYPPQGLELEVTEGVLLDGSDNAIETLHALRGLSISVAIDDFGTGFSSLSYLRQMPINKLKIDRSFVNHIAENSKDAAIVEGIITLAHRLEMEVVAEGIETPDQLEHLNTLDCDIYQGYLFAKPMPITALDAWLTKKGCIRPAQ